jgi:dTDP-4-dehydrorhamnose reductase
MAGHVIKNTLQSNILFDVIDVARSETMFKPTYLIDVTNFELLKSIIQKETPDFIINCIGLLNNLAELNPDLAVLLNSFLPHYLERITFNTDIRIIHISTDCVFSGSKGMYLENDIRDGQGFYAQSKALGEVINKKDLTIRTSIIGPELKNNGIGLFDWFWKQRGSVNGYSRAIWSGVTTIQLAKSIIELITVSWVSGVLHLTNGIPISKFELLKMLKEEFKRDDISLNMYDGYSVDKSFISTRIDFKQNLPSYYVMIHEMRLWIESNKSFYPHMFS